MLNDPWTMIGWLALILLLAWVCSLPFAIVWFVRRWRRHSERFEALRGGDLPRFGDRGAR